MNKIFRYEARRLIFNKFTAGMTLVLAFYSWQILSGEIIQGVAGTAPFSGWSFGLYSARLAPLLSITTLFFVSFFFSKQEERVKTITSAAPVDPQKYMSVRLAACAVCSVVMALFITAIGMVYEKLLFQEASLSAMAASALTVFVPSVLFTLGIGFAAGRINQMLLFVLMPLMFAFAYLPIPMSCEPFGTNFFLKYPVGLTDPAFILTGEMTAGRLVFILMGVVLMIVSLRGEK